MTDTTYLNYIQQHAIISVHHIPFGWIGPHVG